MTDGIDLPESVCETITRGVLWPGWLVTGALTVPFLLGLSVPLRLQVVPLALSVVVLGLPHGAVDHLALPRAQGGPPTPRMLAVVGLVYLGLGGVYALVWVLVPGVAFVTFVLLTLFHWGQGDLYPLLAVVGVDYLDTQLGRVLAVVVRGGLPMVLPLLAFPEWYRRVGDALVSLFAVGSVPAWLFHVETRVVIGAVYGTLVVGYLLRSYQTGENRSAWLIDAGEILLLVVYFVVVPPLLAIGVYFCLWHSLRHIARLLVLEDRTRDAVATGDLWGALRRFSVEAVPLTLAALVLLGGLWLGVPVPPQDLLGRLGVYLVLIALLTLPHVAIVTWMDREQAIWN